MIGTKGSLPSPAVVPAPATLNYSVQLRKKSRIVSHCRSIFRILRKASRIGQKSQNCENAPLTLRGSEYAHAIQELNKAIDRAHGLLQ